MKRVAALLITVVAYFIAESIGGPLWGLGVGIVTTIAVNLLQKSGQSKTAISWRETIFDCLLLLVLFGIDKLVDNTNPEAKSVITSALLAFMLASMQMPFGRRYIENLMESIRSGITRSPYILSLMRQSLWRMTLWAVAATVMYGIAFLTTDGSAKDWIESYGIWVIILGYVATEIVMGRVRQAKYKDVEWVQLVDSDGRVAGGCPRPLVHNGSHWLHAVVHLHVFDNKGRLLLQLRPMSKKIQPGRWDTAVGGHMACGEKLEDALQRETWEEIGLRQFKAQLTNRYIWNSDIEQEYVFVFQTHTNGPFNPKNVGEVDELKFWSVQELEDAIGKGSLTGNLEHELTNGLLAQMKTMKR